MLKDKDPLQDVFVDHDKEDIGDIADDNRERLNWGANNIMPSDKELTTLIVVSGVVT